MAEYEEKLYATVIAVLREGGALKDPTFMDLLKGQKYSVKTGLITDNLVIKISEAVKELDPPRWFENLMTIGLPAGIPLPKTTENLKSREIYTILEHADGPGMAEHVAAKAAEIKGKLADAIKSADPVAAAKKAMGIKQEDMGKGTELAANTAPQGSHSIRGGIIDRGANQDGSGCVSEAALGNLAPSGPAKHPPATSRGQTCPMR